MRENFTILRQRTALDHATFRAKPLDIPSPRGMLSRDSELPLDTWSTLGTLGNVFESWLVRGGLSSALFENSRNLVSSSQELRPVTTGTTRRRESEMKREPLNASIPLPHFQIGSWLILVELILTLLWLIIRGSRFRNCTWANFLSPWNFKAGKSTSKLKYVQNQQIFISRCTGSKKLR